MINRNIITVVLFSLWNALSAQLKFDNLDSLLGYAEKNSVTMKVAGQQSILAKWTKIAALGNTINLRSPVSFSSTDNTLLPVNFIPADFFGGPPGTFRQITLGQRYVSNFNFNPQIDIINPYTWAKVKSASINQELTEVNNLITKESLYESITAAFYNIAALQEQVEITSANLKAADSILTIVKNKFSQGIIREQDVNNALANQLNVKDKLSQLKITLEQQYNSLRILCDFSSAVSLTIVPSSHLNEAISPVKSSASLKVRYNDLQSRLAKSELRANRLSMFPVISLVYYQGWQQNSNTALFDNNAKWIQSKYIGVRISVPFPPDINKMTQSFTSKINYRIALLNNEHTRLQNDLTNASTDLDYEKYTTSFDIAKQVYELKQSNYTKSLNQYKEGILSTDLLLQAFADMLGSRLNLVSAKSALDFNRSKILINNSVK